MPDSRSRSRSPSPYSKRAERSSRREEPPRSRSPRRRYSRSPSPRPRHHERSRSPRRRYEDRPRKSGGGGFRWKEKPRHDDDDRRDDRRLERGYREQERPRQRSPPRDSGKRDDIESKFGPQSENKRDYVEPKFGEAPKEEKKKKKAAPTIAPVGEMIIVNVNDRLGTKASIPCLASDPIKLFKAQVAARIGRQPHEIMLKRQGERPFKDQLTLEDYGVSNGVQLDL
ncbi:hypothetical protein OEA41_006539 [Lepraria neglecta]|uniref:Ubiquitin-like modifier HUB1 n=1 Tax=Lepraria neglecta TaxID=209136 RepID=A0AAD9Z7Y1_9LECA|nr:hypothetical protein OEA41_006539 [Lepraria neglecta]